MSGLNIHHLAALWVCLSVCHTQRLGALCLFQYLHVWKFVIWRIDQRETPLWLGQLMGLAEGKEQGKEGFCCVQGLSSPGWQSVRAGEDPALFAGSPWSSNMRDLPGRLWKTPEQSHQRGGKPIYYSLVCHREKGQGLPLGPSTQHQPHWPGKGLGQGQVIQILNCWVWQTLIAPPEVW